MDEEETMTKAPTDMATDKSIEPVIKSLHCKETHILGDTIAKIKNLIIGNNKYKSIYLRDELINRLTELVNDLYINYLLVLTSGDQNQPSEILLDEKFFDLINQILIIFGSFSLGNVDHLHKLIQKYKIHLILFNIIDLNAIYLRQTEDKVPNCKIVETSIRTLSNLYSSAQIKAELIYQMDCVLYRTDSRDDLPANLKSLIDLYQLNHSIKHYILNIITISAFNLMISSSIKSHSEEQNEANGRHRSYLIKSNFIFLFAGLLISIQSKIQLNCLKFYAYMSFECLESVKTILNTSYYDCGLLDLISSFLSRENNIELQLYSAKCLTNICRSSLISKLDDMDLDSAEFKLVNFNSKLIKFKVLPTLIRLCSAYSSCLKNSNTSKFDHMSIGSSNTTVQNKKFLNIFFLIEILSTLSYLVELSSYLQQTASCLEQIIHLIVSDVLVGYNNLSSGLKNAKLNNKNKSVYNLNKTSCTSLFSLFYLYYNQFSSQSIYYLLNEHQYKVYMGKKYNFIEEFLVYKRLISVGFQTLACLASNSEESRRVVSDSPDLLSRLIESIEINEESFDSDDDFSSLTDYKDGLIGDGAKVDEFKSDATLLRISSLCLLHSLSRSVHQLRTKFLDSKLWNCIIDLIHRLKAKNSECELIKSDDQMEIQTEREDDFSLNEKNLISILIAILANLLIEFSPCKETLLGDDVIKILIEFVNYKNKSIRINSIWALMNLAYHADQKIKQQILAEMTFDRLFQLLTENDEILVLKTLGLIRNLICNRPHIDHLMCFYGTRIIQAVIMVLEADFSDKMIKEQALCILANIADGTNTSKEFIMGNEDLLRKINSFMTDNFTEIQVAAVYCVSNLVNINDEGALERQNKLKEIGAHRILQKLLHSNDPILFEKVKSALQQFSTNVPSNNMSSLF
ncbi:armadillo repeat-containing 8 isoform X1 [Brachionus plicatilis]|uniref:Armadillo repeat-containing protein 8 n=1 Tax=Brachionus plicatilis TaxID=10195 RepID=A0A3M7T3U8_BRAPC|nr:armadillo repeat-containing 8 isoform X1 [Brachionus plicatilis]